MEVGGGCYSVDNGVRAKRSTLCCLALQRCCSHSWSVWLWWCWVDDSSQPRPLTENLSSFSSEWAPFVERKAAKERIGSCLWYAVAQDTMGSNLHLWSHGYGTPLPLFSLTTWTLFISYRTHPETSKSISLPAYVSKNIGWITMVQTLSG